MKYEMEDWLFVVLVIVILVLLTIVMILLVVFLKPKFIYGRNSNEMILLPINLSESEIEPFMDEYMKGLEYKMKHSFPEKDLAIQ